MKQDLTLDDFFTGLLAALADKGIGVLAVRGDSFYEAVLRSYKVLSRRSSAYHIDCRFAIFLDPIYGDSSLVREAVSGAVLKDLASLESFDSQDLRINVDREQAETLLGQLPGERALYAEVADEFLHVYPFVAA